MVVTLHYFRCLPSDWRFIALALQKDESVVFTRKKQSVDCPTSRKWSNSAEFAKWAFPSDREGSCTNGKTAEVKHRKFKLKMT